MVSVLTLMLSKEKENPEIFVLTVCCKKSSESDIIIIIAYAQMTPEEAKNFQPKIVFPMRQPIF
jgi:aspartate 1-decarboxylase